MGHPTPLHAKLGDCVGRVYPISPIRVSLHYPKTIGSFDPAIAVVPTVREPAADRGGRPKGGRAAKSSAADDHRVGIRLWATRATNPTSR